MCCYECDGHVGCGCRRGSSSSTAHGADPAIAVLVVVPVIHKPSCRLNRDRFCGEDDDDKVIMLVVVLEAVAVAVAAGRRWQRRCK